VAIFGFLLWLFATAVAGAVFALQAGAVLPFLAADISEPGTFR